MRKGKTVPPTIPAPRRTKPPKPAPIFAVPAGSAARLQDIAITDVFTSGLVAVGDTARVTVTVESQGFEGKAANLQLLDGETMLDQ